MMVFGLGMFGVSAAGILAVTTQAVTAAGGNLFYMGLLGTMGIGMFGVGALRLPAWARERRRQMSEIAGRLAAASKPTISAGPDLPRIDD